MNNQQAQIFAHIVPVSGTEPTVINNIIKKYLYHWPLFVLGVTLLMIAAYFYLKLASPVYPITATLQFKIPTRTTKDNSLENLDPSSNPIIVTNEIEVIHSKKLIYQVVKNLQLWVNYSTKEWMVTKDLYNKAPVYFSFIDSNISLKPTGEKLEIVIKDANSFVLKDSQNKDKVHAFSTPVRSAFGTWHLEPTSTLGMYTGSQIIIKINDPDLVSDSYQVGIKVELKNKDAPFVNLSMSDQVPARGRDILNSLITLYRLQAQQGKNEQTEKIFEFVDARVDSLKKNLDSQERKLEAYKRNRGITDINAQAENFRNAQELNARAVNGIDVQLSVLASLERYAASSNNNEKLPPGSENFTDRSLIMLYDKLADLQLQRQQELFVTTEANPLFVSIDGQISTLKKDIREKIQTIKEALLANKKQLESFDSGLQSSLNKVPNWETETKVLNRDLESKETIYKFLASKREELALHFASLIPDSEIVDDAHAGAVKWPKPPVVYGIALILGLAAAAGFLYVREIFNDRITSRKQIEDETKIPVLGELAYQDSTDPLVVSAGRSKFAIGEQFRLLRTNLYYLLGSTQGGRVTLFTSSVSGEGKSFVSSNLAVTLAYASKKTILLEMDLRKPKVSAVFGLTTEYPGISDYLNNESAKLESMIRPSGIQGLDVLSCGSFLPNPSELLEKERLDELIATLREKYDDIIVDSPPIHLVSDALIIARITDAALYVVRQNYTHKNELDFIKEIYTSKRFNKFTLVFNCVNRDAIGYGYGNYSYNHNLYPENGIIGRKIKAFSKRF